MGKRTVAASLMAGMLGVLCACSIFGEGKLTLVEKSVSKCVIVLPEKPDPIEKHAADELALFLRKASGAEVKIDTKAGPGLTPIFLGTDARLEGVTDQGFVTRTDGKSLRITGKKPIGVLYGVYDFLEKNVGCRWFAPYDDCEYVPNLDTISVAANMEDRQSPSFEYRVPSPTGGNMFAGKGARDTWDWLVRNKMQIIVYGSGYDKFYDFLRERGAIVHNGGHETFTLSVPDSKYFKTNPEYFCLVDGKRIPQNGYGGGCVEAQACTSNPDVVRLCAEHILEKLAKHPDSYYLLGAGDNGPRGSTKWCECENCVKLDPPGGLDISTRYDIFANAVAKAVHEKNPKADLWVWAYAHYREPPKGITLDPTLTVSLCIHNRNYKDPLTEPCNKRYLKIMEDWRKLAKRVIMREYFGCGLPVCGPAWDTLAADLRLYHKNGIIGWEDEVQVPDAVYVGEHNKPDVHRRMRSYWQYLYLAGKMLWDVNTDENKTLEEARAIYYGKAAPTMEKYYTTLHDVWEKTPGTAGWGIVGVPFTFGKCLAVAGVKEKLEECLAEAEKLAGDDPALKKKIEEEKYFYNEYWVKNYESYLKSKKSPLTAAKAVKPLVIDGKGSDKQWVKTETYSDFLMGDKKPVNGTSVKIMSDEKNLYFHVEALEKNVGKLSAKCEKRDGPVWEDDSVEIFLLNQKEGDKYWQFCINPKGVVFDSEWGAAMSGNPKFNADIEIKTSILPDRWIVEARIPAAALGEKSFEGAGWKVNVCRARKAKGDSDPGETSSLSGSGFHDYERFRTLNLGEPLVDNGSFDEAVKAVEKAELKKWEIKGGEIPAKWGFYQDGGKAELLVRDEKTGDRALKVSGCVFQLPSSQWAREGFERNVVFSCEAKGSGKLSIAVFRYGPRSKERVKKLGNGLDFIRTDVLKSFELSPDKWAVYECAHKIPEGEYYALALMVDGEATLDNVSITPASQV